MKFVDKLFETQKDEFKMTTWVNNTNHVARFMVMLDNVDPRTFCGKARAIRLEPGETVTLQSIYDNAIRQIDKDTGRVIGGLCPWLDKAEDDERPEMMECLDFETVIEEEAAKKLAVKLQKDQAMAEARKQLAEKKLADAEAPKKTRAKKAE